MPPTTHLRVPTSQRDRMTDETLRANPEDRPAPPRDEQAPGKANAPAAVPAAPATAVRPTPAPAAPDGSLAAEPDFAPATAHTRPIRAARQHPAVRDPAWLGFLAGAAGVVAAIGLALALWQFAGGEMDAPPVAALGTGDLIEIETLLDQLGFPPGKLDGVIDAESVTAIQDFQLTAGLPVDGIAGPALLEELRGAFAELSGE